MASHQTSLIVYRGFPGSGIYVWSPFVTKLEAHLRFGGLSYRTEVGSKFQAPRDKLPYISISTDNSAPITLSDSTLIAARLAEDGLLKDLNAKLSPANKAHDLAIRALLEDKLYFYQTYERWHDNYYTMRPGVLSALPYPMQIVVGLLAYRQNMKILYGQGTGRFSPEEISSFRLQIWESISALLVESKRKSKLASASDDTFWVMGMAQPTEADATVFGFISSALVCPAGPETRKVVDSFPVLEDYARRIHLRYFPDYALWE